LHYLFPTVSSWGECYNRILWWTQFPTPRASQDGAYPDHFPVFFTFSWLSGHWF